MLQHALTAMEDLERHGTEQIEWMGLDAAAFALLSADPLQLPDRHGARELCLEVDPSVEA